MKVTGSKNAWRTSALNARQETNLSQSINFEMQYLICIGDFIRDNKEMCIVLLFLENGKVQFDLPQPWRWEWISAVYFINLGCRNFKLWSCRTNGYWISTCVCVQNTFNFAFFINSIIIYSRKVCCKPLQFITWLFYFYFKTYMYWYFLAKSTKCHWTVYHVHIYKSMSLREFKQDRSIYPHTTPGYE